MPKIYPPNHEHISRNLIRAVKERLIESDIEYEKTYFSNVEFIYNIEHCPPQICAIKIDDEIMMSILPTKLIKLFGQGKGIGHFPIIEPSKLFRIISADGEDVTTYYISNRDRLLLEEIEIDINDEKNLFLLRAKILKKIGPIVSKIWKEVIMTVDDIILAKAEFIDRCFFISDFGFYIKYPFLPKLIIEYDPDESLVYFSSESSKTLKGVLELILLKSNIINQDSKIPSFVPNIVAEVDEAEIDEEPYEEDEINLLFLLNPLTQEEICKNQKKIIEEFIKNRKIELNKLKKTKETLNIDLSLFSLK